MIRRIALTVAALIASAASAGAQPGINLTWNQCVGPNNATFACNTNSGSHFLFGSFVAPAGITQLSSNEILLDVMTSAATMPSWWEFRNTGACRQNALSISFDATSDPSGNCADYWQGQAAGGLAAYQAPTAYLRRIIAVGAVPIPALGPVDEGTEYFSFRLAINHSASTGTGSCAGCTTPVCVRLTSIKLTQPVGVGDFLLTNPATGNCVTWQGGVPICCLVPATKQTWGSIKALYR